MKILAFDTSSTALSVALLEDEKLVAESTVTVKKNHSISLMPTIDFLVAQAGWQPSVWFLQGFVQLSHLEQVLWLDRPVDFPKMDAPS